ncbi:glycosyl hydrolase 108 family protein [uncultured Algoriphagus sp.]|uniref:glycoside hydrolase family 108 protein n=1 Tax=uncultured Algoriphagus sp. TaxID=417365 RepID=UPI0030EB4BE9
MKPKIRMSLLKRTYFIFLFLMMYGCTVQDYEAALKSSANEQLLSEAKSWFTNQSGVSSIPNARVINFIDGEPIWNDAKEHFYMGKPVLEIPVDLNVENLFALKNEEWKEQAGDYRVLLFKIGENEFQPYLMKVESQDDQIASKHKDLSYLNLLEIPSDFSGSYSFFYLDGRFVGSWNIEEGERVRAVSYSKPVDKIPDNSNARVNNYTYHCVITTYTTYVQSGTGEPQIVEQYKVWDCIFTPMFAGSGPDDNGGGESPGCYEPHPNFEGLMVPCNEPDPCNNFEDLVNKVLNTEGGFVNDPLDKGGATNKGISWRTWQDAAESVLGKEPTLENLQNLTAEGAKAIYKAKYWDSIRLSEIEDGDLRWLIFDFHVNSGPNAMRQLQMLLNELGADLTVDGIIGSKTINFINEYEDIIELYNGYKQTRINFLEDVVANDIQRHLKIFPQATEQELKSLTQLRFKNGWLNRVNEFIEKTFENFENVNC